MRSPSTEIIRTLEQLTHSHRRWEIFADWVNVCYQGLRMLPKHAESVFSGDGLAQDDEEATETFRQIDEDYGREGYKIFRKAYWQLLDAAEQEPYYDPFGTVYEEWELGNAEAGQYFTPQPLCRMMAQITAEEAADSIRSRLRQAFSSSPTVKMAELLGVEIGDTHLQTLVADAAQRLSQVDYEPIRVCDPACGSGRLLMAVAEQVPQWMVHHGLILFSGQDIDRDCIRMTRANTMLYGMNGHALFIATEQAGGSSSTRRMTGEQLVLL